ncbi:hypothetical protein LIER_39762 [Lithospermum erythrorhizon]|uniref:Srp40 C-terminal domain-containing protein n=1 Tax=Lithospermum erythrorhizon TaxID=34254 RepID=A0AAV3QJV1_LITER
MMSEPILKPCKSKDIDGKKKKKKMAIEPNLSLKVENDLQTTEVDATNRKKKKQKKNKLVTESIDGDENKSDIKSSLPEEKPKTSLSEETMNTNYKKKKKNKKTTDAMTENNASVGDEVNTIEKKTKKETKEKKKNKTTTDPLTENIDSVCAEVNTSEKKIKKETKEKKNKKTTDPLIGNTDTVSAEVNTTEKKTKKETKEKRCAEPSDILASNNQMSKKRKRSDESEVEHAEETTAKDSKRRKPEGLVADGEQIVANGEIAGNDPMKLSKNGLDKSGQRQHRNDSAEPKTYHAFQRVKIDEVEFVDDRLQDNSYWAKNGAEKGYGAKAQEILGQVKGR